jgi:hypothetical protein
MVHELHKAGYQRIRISPAMAPNGIHWRCSITFAENVAADGYSVIDGSDGLVALYTSGQGADYFDWPGAETMTARLLADRFLEAFPAIAARGAGRDWTYAGWLTDVLGRAEHGRFVYFRADYPLDEEELERWKPPAFVSGPAVGHD